MEEQTTHSFLLIQSQVQSQGLHFFYSLCEGWESQGPCRGKVGWCRITFTEFKPRKHGHNIKIPKDKVEASYSEDLIDEAGYVTQQIFLHVDETASYSKNMLSGTFTAREKLILFKLPKPAQLSFLGINASSDFKPIRAHLLLSKS